MSACLTSPDSIKRAMLATTALASLGLQNEGLITRAPSWSACKPA
eukprot:CAMPEP_0205923896 /NCGR_PEP_ID=MMETSP1325-20131115/16663_1 /ASSEMBLY_ACC=CAM_ASM_000708 /TAXON_ID=236786 /ORGANISM="Florenciella sp., Strain RCC1007" /LENGTH=44 /DNA_ID= /DNA_START= /DNA_END= /DNA_ORIENTATION=